MTLLIRIFYYILFLSRNLNYQLINQERLERSDTE